MVDESGFSLSGRSLLTARGVVLAVGLPEVPSGAANYLDRYIRLIVSGAAGGTHVIEALNATVTKVTQLPGLGERDKAFSYEVVGPAFPFDMAQRIQEESVEWADLIKLAAISAQN